MINAMKYKEEISNVGCDFRILEKNNKIVGCGSCADEMKCQECKFGYDEQGRTCDITRTEWLCQEYKEPIKLSRLEYELLKYYIEHGYLYIARDNNKALFAYDTKPRKIPCQWWTTENIKGIYFDECFKFIKWEDEESTLIQDILKNCEVIENEKI